MWQVLLKVARASTQRPYDLIMPRDQTFDTDIPDWFAAFSDSDLTTLGEHGEMTKDDVRVMAYGECAAANSAVGLAMAVGQLPVEVTALLTSVQNDLLDLAADLFVPRGSPVPAEARISDVYVRRIERAALFYSREVGEPDTRVLPGGTAAAALLYFARNEVRRAERSMWTATKAHPSTVSPVTGRYLNRLSTLLLLLARVANLEHGNIDWDPGASARAMGAPDVLDS